MKKLKFKCTLLTDVILNVKSASEGANSTLDFIPGNCFLGIVASQLYDKVYAEDAMAIFHRGLVRFGDAHPSKGGKRALRIPASFFYAKGDSVYDQCYIHHFIKDADAIKATNGAKAQLKQCRTGFYVMTGENGEEVLMDKSFALKSAYDRDQRRSKDAAMYGYESLVKGAELLFSVEIDAEEYERIIVDSLVGERRVGRSRTAQYGLVRIEECTYDEVETCGTNGMVVIYADSRLIFLDDNTQPTFRPTVQQLLGKDANGIISWEDSQVRTFQYAPWNYKRQCYDTDRCGIEKGSVIVVKEVDKAYCGSATLGSYQCEGFGSVLFNPIFLAQAGENGEAKCKFKKEEKPQHGSIYAAKIESQSALFKYLAKKDKEKSKDDKVYKSVNEWEHAKLFIGKETFASQWGAIRSIALRCRDNDEIQNQIEDYISNGVKKENWYGARAKALSDFMKDHHDNLWAAIINLASEMAKKCAKK